MSDAIFDRFTPKDIAKAVAASNRILIELLVSNGVERQTIEHLYKTKSQHLITQQFDDGAGQLLMLLGGFLPRREAKQ